MYEVGKGLSVKSRKALFNKLKKHGFWSFPRKKIELSAEKWEKETKRTQHYVCKRWANLISDPLFIDTHLSQSLTQAKTSLIFQGKRYKIYNNNTTTTKRSRSSSIHICEMEESGEIQLRFQLHHLKGRVISTCNGLILLQHLRNLHGLNPITHQRLTLPNSDLSLRFPLHPKSIGFAFEPSSKKYKIISFFKDKKGVCLHCQVITLGSNSHWRVVDGPFSHLGIVSPQYL
ncbi:putative F-box protein At4g09190 [Tasmannia lanceolata]|uniref:putative F-box protein At4g09190 n=1 Tax=Tasmannia lanceolata TaxID=3420 RepID=UPI0040630DE4